VISTASCDPALRRQPSRPELPAGFDRASWRESAACQRLDTEIFFPIGKTGLAIAEIRRAKAICARCPVRAACLAYAVETNQEYGIWGGYDEDERRLLRRQFRQPAAAAGQ
jgi:WhiB family redox-sensing transcriptional regulator